MATSIGEQLRLAREERGMGLREICDQTRISVHYLEAIEANDYKRLPGGVFNRSFIKAYAKCVGYDEREAIEGYTRYLREHGESSDDVNTHPHYSKVYTDTPATRSPVLTVLLAILILALLTAAALAALYWFQKRAAVTPARSESLVVCHNYFLFAPEEQHVYSSEVNLFSRSVRSDMLLRELTTHRAPNGALGFFGDESYKQVAPNGAEAMALNQTNAPMYNGLTSAIIELGTHDHIRYF